MAADRVKKCYKIPLENEIRGNLNLAYDEITRTVVLWSKYQLYVYKDNNFNVLPFMFESTFPIEKVLIHNNHLLCLDCSGNIHLCTPNYTLSPQKLTAGENFAEWQQNILACETIFDQYVVCLTVKEQTSVLFITKYNTTFEVIYLIELANPDKDWKIPARGNCLIVSENISPGHLIHLKNLFTVKRLDANHRLYVISLDKMNVYSCLISEKLDENIEIKQLYKSHSEIIGIEILINKVCIVIGLSSGNIVKLSLTKSISDQKPEIIHLNTPLYKFKAIENSVIYTDGLTMWKTENVFSESDPVFKQYFVMNVRDFCMIKKQIICVTFSNFIYSFCSELLESFITPSDNESCCDVKLVTNSDYFKDIKKTIQENEEISARLNKESEYLMALALSCRQDVMDSFIHVKASVFDDYNDLVQENTGLSFTDEIKDYYDSCSYYFLVKISIPTIQHKLNKLLSHLLGDMKVHITLFTNRVLKTTSIQINEQLKKKNFVIALKESKMPKNISRIRVYIRIVTTIPAKLDETLRQWITVYRKCIALNVENFIKTRSNTNSTFLKDDEPTLETVICKRARYLHGSLYQFNIPEGEKYQWTFHVKLPNNYMQILSNEMYYKEYLDSKKINIFVKQKNIGKHKKWVEFQIGEEKVVLNIENDELTMIPLLTVSCPNIYIASHIRNLFSKIIFSAIKDSVMASEFVNHKLYTDIENLQREIRYTMERQTSHEEFSMLHIKFNKIIFGSFQI